MNWPVVFDNELFSIVARLSFVEFVYAAYQYLVIQELTASSADTGSQALCLYLVFTMVGVFYGIGAALQKKETSGEGAKNSGSPFILIGLAILFSLICVLRTDFLPPVKIGGISLTLLSIAAVNMLIGHACAGLWTRILRVRRERTGLVAGFSCAFLGVGYYVFARLGPSLGVNACFAVLGFLSILMGFRGRPLARIAIGTLVIITAAVSPIDRLIESYRTKHLLYLTPEELAAFQAGKMQNILDSWSNVGKLNLYRIQNTSSTIAFYNYVRTWIVDPSTDIAPKNTRSDLAVRPQTISDFDLREKDRMLVIGTGGGERLARMPAGRLKDVTGVEINSGVLAFFQKHPEFNNRVYQKIDILNMDGRAALDEISSSYDRIVIEFAHIGSHELNGMFRVDDFLTTRESLKKALNLLTPHGSLLFLSFQAARAGEVAEALTEIGAPVKTARFELWPMTKFNADDRPSVRYPFAVISSRDPLQLAHEAELLRKSGWAEISPAFYTAARTDDSPMANNPALLWAWGLEKEAYRNNPFLRYLTAKEYRFAGELLFAFSCLSALALASLLPIVWRSREAKGLNLFYFCRIGAGFSLLQFYFLAKLRAYFGDPLRTAIAVNWVMMSSAALGSVSIERIRPWFSASRHTAVVLLCVFLYTYWIASHIPFHWSNTILKLLISVCLVAPAGFIAGLFLPLGLSSIDSKEVGLSMLLDSCGAALGTALFFLTAWIPGISYNIYWIALFYISACCCLGYSQSASKRGRSPVPSPIPS